MTPSAERVFLEGLEQSLARGTAGEPDLALLLIAGRDVDLDPDELRGARRRAVQLLAASGSPLRDLDPDGRAVRALADDLDAPERRTALAEGLEALSRDAEGLALVQQRIFALDRDEDAAWRWYACTLLAEELTPS